MSPFARNIHHITIAVHGDKPKSMTPAMYEEFPAKKTFANKVIKGGAIIQLAIIVTKSGLGFRAAFFMSLNRIPTTVGYIMKNSSMPIGIDNWANLSESMNSPNSGINLPINKPTTMQMAIQSVRYFSPSPNGNSFFTCSSLPSKPLFTPSISLFNHLFCKHAYKFRSEKGFGGQRRAREKGVAIG